jgi:uncharacterized membrane protein
MNDVVHQHRSNMVAAAATTAAVPGSSTHIVTVCVLLLVWVSVYGFVKGIS